MDTGTAVRGADATLQWRHSGGLWCWSTLLFACAALQFSARYLLLDYLSKYYSAVHKATPTYLHFALIGKFRRFLHVTAGARQQHDEIKHIMQIDNLWLPVAVRTCSRELHWLSERLRKQVLETILNPPLQLWRWQFSRYDSTWEKLQRAHQSEEETVKKKTIQTVWKGEQVDNQQTMEELKGSCAPWISELAI